MEVYQAGETIPWQFNTRDGDGAPITFAGSPAVAVRKDAATATTTDGVSLTVDSGSVTGLHTLSIDTSQNGTFYADGHEFSVIVTAGTVDGTSVVGEVVLRFRLGEVSADVQAWDGGAVPTPAEAGAAMTLTEAYDAAKTAAPSAATVAGAVLDEALGEHAGFLTTLLTAAGYTVPDNASIALILADTGELQENQSNWLTADVSGLSTAAALAIVDGIVDQIKAILDKLDTAMEADGAVYRFTENALEEAPSGEATGPIEWNPSGEGEVMPFVRNGVPVQNVLVAAYSEEGRSDPSLISSAYSNANGIATLYFSSPGTYYFRAKHASFNVYDWSEEVTS